MINNIGKIYHLGTSDSVLVTSTYSSDSGWTIRNTSVDYSVFLSFYKSGVLFDITQTCDSTTTRIAIPPLGVHTFKLPPGDWELKASSNKILEREGHFLHVGITSSQIPSSLPE